MERDNESSRVWLVGSRVWLAERGCCAVSLKGKRKLTCRQPRNLLTGALNKSLLLRTLYSAPQFPRFCRLFTTAPIKTTITKAKTRIISSVV